MTNFSDLIQQGTAHAWLFIPTAILLGALHGLEPGHSKTMMAAFIIAIRGTIKQAVLLGVCATLSHTLIVWVIALGGMYLWRDVAPETFEPYLQVASGAIIICMAIWMILRTRHETLFSAIGHHHHDAVHRVDTGHGVLRLEIFEDGVPPCFRIFTESGSIWPASRVTLKTERPDGIVEDYTFIQQDGFLQSSTEIPEPHEFMARLNFSHGNHSHSYDLAFEEHDHNHEHDHIHEEETGLDLTARAQDAHALAHANDIRRRFADRNVTNGQIVLFGLTGGLIPCPGAITVLLLCLQLKQLTLGAVLVLCFSIGLALTMVTSGVVAALSIKHISKRFSGFGEIVRKAPYVSGAVIMLIGLYVGINGWLHLAGHS